MQKMLNFPVQCFDQLTGAIEFKAILSITTSGRRSLTRPPNVPAVSSDPGQRLLAGLSSKLKFSGR